jgi:adenosylmethionine-8-amino-7-oxononanoate aminotransferase
LHDPCVAGEQRAVWPKRWINTRLKLQGLENGLTCYPMAGSFDGVAGDHARLAPLYIISEAQLDEVVDKLAHPLDQVVAG